MYTNVQITLTSFDYSCIGETGSVCFMDLWNETSEKFSIEKQHVLYLVIFDTSTYQLSRCYMRLGYEEMDCF